MKLSTKQRVDWYLGGALIFALRPIVSAIGNLMGRDHQLEVRGTICVQKFIGGGSLLLALPALEGLRRRYPDFKLLLVCSPEVESFARTLDLFDRILVLDDSRLTRLVSSGLAAWAACFRADTIIDLEVYSRLSTVLSVLTCARNRLGFFLHNVFWRRGLHTHLVFFNSFSGSFYFYEKLVELLDAEPSTLPEIADRVRARLPDRGPPSPDRTCIGASCSDLAPERMLTASQWRRVLLDRAGSPAPRTFVFHGAARDRELADSIIREVSGELPQHRFENLCGSLSLDESLANLCNAAEFWGIDSALLHYARIFGVSCVSWWGPTDPQTRLKPFQGLSEEVVYRKIPCSPCVHLAEAAPCNGNNLCIRNLFEEPGDGELEWSPYVT
jgi:ADP-heptose:LPS heptosyltransferase